MKKAMLTFGLFSMIMILTSFTAPSEIGGSNVPKTGTTTNPVRVYEIGGSNVPKTGTSTSFADIGGSNVPKTGTTNPEIGGSNVPRTGGADA